MLEINPRHSPSHAQLFADVDGMTNHEIMLRLAMDRDPEFPSGRGRYAMAAKLFLRRFSDGLVRRHPSPQDIETIERAVTGTSIDLTAHAGDVLSALHEQDMYSYELASVYIGGADEAELAAKFDQVSYALRYEIDDRSVG